MTSHSHKYCYAAWKVCQTIMKNLVWLWRSAENGADRLAKLHEQLCSRSLRVVCVWPHLPRHTSFSLVWLLHRKGTWTAQTETNLNLVHRPFAISWPFKATQAVIQKVEPRLTVCCCKSSALKFKVCLFQVKRN